MIQLKTSLNKIEITYIEKSDFPLSIDGVHLHDSDIKELYKLLKTQVYKDKLYTFLPEVLNDILKYIENTQVQIDGEWGDGRTLEQLIVNKEMPKLYHDLIDLKNER